MLQTILTTALGILVFLFIFWKRLKEDYAPQIIFTVSFYVLIGITVGWLISTRFFPQWFLWVSLVGAVLGLILGIIRFKIRFFESFESLTGAGLPWLSFTFLADSVVNSSLSSFIAFLATLFIILIFYYLDTHFRDFTWYASGKVGFAGMTTLALIFLVRAAVSLAGISVISFVNNYEAIASGVGAFVCFVLLYNLSRKIA